METKQRVSTHSHRPFVFGIDASRAFLARRTGIEEYSYQVIRHLCDELRSERVMLYVRKRYVWHGGFWRATLPNIDFPIPEKWIVRGLFAPRLWTQARLSLEMLVHPPDILFVPAHTVPLIHPRRTVVVIHGLEYEFCPKGYSRWERLYMRLSILYSTLVSSQVIAVSENTKKDLIERYGVKEGRIRVIPEGYEERNFSAPEETASPTKPFLLFVGRIEERKNIKRIIEAFEILKERRTIPHELVLVGKPGHGYESIQERLKISPYAGEIRSLGYVSETEKQALFGRASVFVFPSLYEGFGLPILEAQTRGVPVVTSNLSSLPEVGGAGAVYVDPYDAEAIAEGVERLLSDDAYRSGILEQATHNISRFSWQKCARAIAALLTEGRA